MKKTAVYFFLIIFLVSFQNCDFRKDISESNTADLNVYLTDAPLELDNGETVEQINVLIKRVDVVKKCEDEINNECVNECDCQNCENCNCDNCNTDGICECDCECDCECSCNCNDADNPDEDCVFTVLDTDTSLNLLDYADGVTYLLGSVTLEPGEYLQLRFIVDVEQSTIKFAGDDNLYPLQIPSGGESGIKIKGNAMNPLFIIEEGEEADLIFDFDAQMSIIAGQDRDNYKLLPVIKEVKFRNRVIEFTTE